MHRPQIALTEDKYAKLTGMPSPGRGSIPLFRVAGIEVFLHWSWFVVAVIEIASQQNRYSSLAWNALEYLALFAIVLMHEFGHALACRQVGGKADRIMLWPLGGVAYVNPPLRPGATLWSIAAGPLVNLALLLPLGALGGRYLLAEVLGSPHPQSDMATWLAAVLSIDIALLLFNILPIYPLDGGQILRSLLWYVIGRSRSFAVATGLGVLGAIVLMAGADCGIHAPELIFRVEICPRPDSQ
jgi:Zn-dependent protease